MKAAQPHHYLEIFQGEYKNHLDIYMTYIFYEYDFQKYDSQYYNIRRKQKLIYVVCNYFGNYQEILIYSQFKFSQSRDKRKNFRCYILSYTYVYSYRTSYRKLLQPIFCLCLSKCFWNFFNVDVYAKKKLLL